MGNSSNNGDFRLQVKHDELHWLTDAQVPDLNALGEGTYRIYAHDELQSVTDVDGNYGVSTGYNSGVLYGLSYTRQGQTFNTTTRNWVNQTQTIDLEYRSGKKRRGLRSLRRGSGLLGSRGR